MQRFVLKSKIHRARITDANLHYEGSLTVDPNLLEAADIIPYEKVDVVNINNGQRFTTYVIKGRPGSGDICLNGAAARLGAIDDLIIIITYTTMSDKDVNSHKPVMVFVDGNNQILSVQK